MPWRYGNWIRPTEKRVLFELALLFFKLGVTAFGGPAAHIAMMEEEVVARRKWMTRDRFLDLVGATNLIPGPNSTEMAIHIGYARAGLSGLIISGISFIVPAVVITGILAWAYVKFGTLPDVSDFLFGIKPVVVSIILVAVIRLGKSAAKNVMLTCNRNLCGSSLSFRYKRSHIPDLRRHRRPGALCVEEKGT